ncbi:MAG: hypothetical protein M3Y50_07560 [Acidobacteriota bacterium]|nr:hypothetical protein [Acidobacteriota bacterium]
MPSPSRLRLCCAAVAQDQTIPTTREQVVETARGTLGSPYIALDSWICPAVARLHDLGYLPTAYMGMRPFTRISLDHMLQISKPDVKTDAELYGTNDEAVEIFARLNQELQPEHAGQYRIAVQESEYAIARDISGPVLNDSYHFGQTFINDYGRLLPGGLQRLHRGEWLPHLRTL